MKEIKTERYKQADLKTWPNTEKILPPFKSDNTDTKDDIKKNLKKIKNTKKKKLPQLGIEVEDVNLRDITD